MLESQILPLSLLVLICLSIGLWLSPDFVARIERRFQALADRVIPVDGSGIRSLTSWVALLAIAVALGLLVSGTAEPARLTSPAALAYAYIWVLMLSGFSLIHFSVTVLSVLYLASRRREFHLKLERLWRDTFLSMLLNIASFALLFQLFGVVDPTGEITTHWRDLIYFSSVTFSTLGYGDFQPAPPARLWAGFEAIIGNLHLGIFVGSMLLTAKAK
ncbi:hypothetical protein RSK20926_21115 [Roseobacter sp. SK209-2-6]|uniref:ion channel n=1 Tax=Roseobacter sp. SK209-2-6 TaxID=388739 RepID=UPI0000F3E7E8|nr:ion channel [Roseobacter sp. SK209-2-6]EBA16267.1 hypothetical protein RSK20926_21115 [Roseobacter sp. SK209-2-6]